MLFGQDQPLAAFLAAAESGTLHHAWLLAGPRGVGKAAFARGAATRLLAHAVGEPVGPGLDVPAGRTATLMAAGSHPDFKLLARLPKNDKGEEGAPATEDDLAREITVAQVRALLGGFATAPSLSFRRVVVIDAADDLARAGANALLKGLEEPPQGTVFLLVSHQPGRLLPTIRSRCRLLRFEPLGAVDMKAALAAALPDADQEEVAMLARAGEGSPGRALGYAGLDLAAIDAALAAIAGDGDPRNERRARLAKELSGRTAQRRYEAFLERAPSFIAATARERHGTGLRTALDAYDEARSIAVAARPLSMAADATVYELAGLVARLANP